MITSASNEKVRYIRSLHRRHTRQLERSFVIEGIRLVEDALRAGVVPRLVLYDPEALAATERGQSLLGALQAAGSSVFAASEAAVGAASDTVTPQGIVAVVPMPEWETTRLHGPVLAVVVDGLQDPGNLGTIIRTAEAAGVDGIWLTPDTVDPYNPKVVRAGMGAHFRLPIYTDQGPENMRELGSSLEQLLASSASGKQIYYEVDWTRPSGLVIGSEARGIGPQVERLVTETIRIPMPGGAESLNAAVAAGVIIFEALRQRAMSGIG